MATKEVKREFNNGHKTLNAAEAKALQELLKSEKDKVNPKHSYNRP
jgi:hypothetical protein